MSPSLPHRRFGRIVVTGLALLAGAVPGSSAVTVDDPPAAATEEALPTPAELATWRILREMRVKPLPPLEEIAPRLAAVAGASLPSLFGIMETRSIPASEGSEAQMLSEYQEGLILAAFRHLDAARVLAVATTRCEPAGSPRACANAIRIAGAVGDATRIPKIFAWAAIGPGGERPKFMHAAVEEALTELLRRDPRAMQHVSTYWRGFPDDFMPDVVRAVGAAGDAGEAEFLGEVIRWRYDLALAALAQFPRLAMPDSLDARTELANAVRPYLEPHDPMACQAAALALGELRDHESIPALIELLEEEGAGVRANARSALSRITGLSFPASSRIWGEWYAEETRWGRARLGSVMHMLSSESEQRVAEGIREASKHPLFRHELSTAILPVLDHRQARYRDMACRMLGQLDSPVSIPALVDGLEDRDEKVRESALRALRRVTGRNLSPDREDWVAAIDL